MYSFVYVCLFVNFFSCVMFCVIGTLMLYLVCQCMCGNGYVPILMCDVCLYCVWWCVPVSSSIGGVIMICVYDTLLPGNKTHT
jgi:hypothetical protein